MFIGLLRLFSVAMRYHQRNVHSSIRISATLYSIYLTLLRVLLGRVLAGDYNYNTSMYDICKYPPPPVNKRHYKHHYKYHHCADRVYRFSIMCARVINTSLCNYSFNCYRSRCPPTTQTEVLKALTAMWMLSTFGASRLLL